MNQEKILCFLLEDVVLVGENCLSLFYSEGNVYFNSLFYDRWRKERQGFLSFLKFMKLV